MDDRARVNRALEAGVTVRQIGAEASCHFSAVSRAARGLAPVSEELAASADRAWRAEIGRRLVELGVRVQSETAPEGN